MKISTLNTSYHIANFPPQWASEWGEDDYGLFADLTIDHKTNIVQRFRFIAAGEFMMGSPKNEKERYEKEDYHKVTISQSYWLADTTVTQEAWKALMGNNPANFKDNIMNPVERVSWEDAQAYIKKLNDNMGKTLERQVIRLPTEAEWEHACRAGTETPFSFGENITPKQVNYDGNYPYAEGKKGEYREKTVAVKSLPVNPWGLYEMHGNVWEWCADAWQELGEQATVDPYYDDSVVALRVVRGGSWIYLGGHVRSAYRNRLSPGGRDDHIGFRLSLGHELQLRSKKKG